MSVAEKIKSLASLPYICDHCLGRQFGQLLTGLSNDERGRAVRMVISMMDDAGELKSEQSSNLRSRNQNPSECWVCKGAFREIPKIAKRMERKSRKIEFNTFLVGVRISGDMLFAEEELWEKVGIDFTEPIKEELSREIGKEFSRLTGKEFSRKPDVEFIVDFGKDEIEMNVMPVFIFGIYKKLKPGIPQTRWPSGKYKNSVEQIIGRVMKRHFKADDYKLHGAGREDIDATCTGGRPFVMELINPRKRTADLRKIEEEIRGKWVEVEGLRYSDMDEVRRIKEARFEKEYVAEVEVEGEIRKSDLRKLKSLVGTIKQRTPLRVVHRRADKIRKRKVLKISAKYVSPTKFILRVRTEAGTYVKELVSGDKGRTKPSVSSILGVPCRVVSLDVRKVFWK